MYVHGIDMYIHCTVQTCMYIVQTCMYMFIQVYSRVFDSYKHVHIMYKLEHVHTCDMSVPYFLFTYMYVNTADVPCTDGFIHFMKCTDVIELCTYIDVSFLISAFCFAWLAGL